VLFVEVAPGNLDCIFIFFIAPDFEVNALELQRYLGVPPLTCTTSQRLEITATYRDLVIEFLVANANVEPIAIG
jgi:hypothetical protein